MIDNKERARRNKMKYTNRKFMNIIQINNKTEKTARIINRKFALLKYKKTKFKMKL